MVVVSSKNSSNNSLLTNILLITRNEHCQWKVYKEVFIFSSFCPTTNDLNITDLLVISDSVKCEVFKYAN